MDFPPGINAPVELAFIHEAMLGSVLESHGPLDGAVRAHRRRLAPEQSHG